MSATGGSCQGTNYDFFLLVEQWAITECMASDSRHPSECAPVDSAGPPRPAPRPIAPRALPALAPLPPPAQDVFSCRATNQFFTLHGLWPEDNNGNYPCTCSSAKFNERDVEDLLPALNTYWPSLSGPSATFWAHEYEKHGTCATDVFPKTHDFFNGTLALRAAFDAMPALAAAGIKPSNTASFTLSAFHAALTKAYGAAPVVACDSQGRIETITFCVSKALGVIACPPSTTDDCSASQVYLPASMTEPVGGDGALRGARA